MLNVHLTTYRVVATLLFLSVSLAACDFVETSESDTEAAWTGNWEATSGPTPIPDGAELYIHVSRQEYVTVGVQEGECSVNESRILSIRDVEPEGETVGEVLDIAGDVVRIQFNEGVAESRLQADNQQLLLTILSSPAPGEGSGDQIRARKVDFDPRNLDVCADANVVSESAITSFLNGASLP